MDIYLTVGIVVIGMSFLLMSMFINVFIEQFKEDDEQVGYIEGIIVYRT